MRVSKELAKGSTGLLVLSVIEREDLYGYQIAKEIEALSEEVFKLGEGTLYPVLHALEKEGYLTCYWEETEGGRRRKYYKITPSGMEELGRRRAEWSAFSGAVEKVIWRRDHAFGCV